MPGNRWGTGSTPAERIKSKYSVHESGCWIIHKPGPRRYGNFVMNGRQFGLHKASWIIHRGPVPKGMHVLHTCDVPRCCNPDHLYLGTNLDNRRDRALRCPTEAEALRKLQEGRARRYLKKDSHDSAKS